MLDLGIIKILTKKEFRRLRRETIDYKNMSSNMRQELNKVTEQCLTLTNDNEYLGTTIDELKKEVKQLKALLTKNKISYKKEKKEK